MLTHEGREAGTAVQTDLSSCVVADTSGGVTHADVVVGAECKVDILAVVTAKRGTAITLVGNRGHSALVTHATMLARPRLTEHHLCNSHTISAEELNHKK